MKRIIYTLLCTSCLFAAACLKQGSPIAEPKFGIYKFTTFTVDTFRFKVIINGETITDSLLSPQGVVNKSVAFYEPAGNIKIIDTKTNAVILDSSVTMKRVPQPSLWCSFLQAKNL
jgi:hypothetical protein